MIIDNEFEQIQRKVFMMQNTSRLKGSAEQKNQESIVSFFLIEELIGNV